MDPVGALDGVGQQDEGRDDAEAHQGAAQDLRVHLRRVEHVLLVQVQVGGTEEDLEKKI